jgi:hypothetical protein
MLYSGFYQFSRHSLFETSPEFVNLSLKLVTNPSPAYSLKELTLFFTYFREMRITQPRFCTFIKSTLSTFSQSELWHNLTASKLCRDRPCLMDLDELCQKCLARPPCP